MGKRGAKPTTIPMSRTCLATFLSCTHDVLESERRRHCVSDVDVMRVGSVLADAPLHVFQLAVHVWNESDGNKCAVARAVMESGWQPE